MDHLQLSDFTWVFDFINPDADVRQAAIARQAELVAELVHIRDQGNDVYRRTGSFLPADPQLNAELQQLHSARAKVLNQMAWTPLMNFLCYAEPRVPYAEIAPFAVLFLQREHLFPEDWGRMWHTKRHVLRTIAQHGPTLSTHDDLLVLLEATIRRQQRAEDGGFVKVARTLDPSSVRRIVIDARDSEDATIRERAAFVEWAVANPHSAVSLASWRQWRGGPKGDGSGSVGD